MPSRMVAVERWHAASLERSTAASEIVVTARRRSEQAQDVPIPISVVGVKELDNTGSFNVARLAQLQPTLQFYSTNPRNSSVNIRGLGAPLGLTNDGIAIHGTKVEKGYASHGCIGVPNDFGKKLFAVTKLGDVVYITKGKRIGKGDSLVEG